MEPYTLAPDDDVRWMRLALAEAAAAGAAGEVPVGAVLVRGGAVIATGRNAPIARRDPTAHAEIEALRAGAAALGNYRLDGCTLYATLEPCAMCAGAVLHARLGRVVFGAGDPTAGAAGSVVDLFAEPRLNHRVHVAGGVLAEECGGLLREFFRERRSLARARAEPLRDDALRTPAARFAAFDGALLGTSRWVSDLPSQHGWRLHHAEEGPAEAPVCVVALHAPGQWGWQYRHLAAAVRAVNDAALARGAAAPLRLLVPDLIGHGRSDKPKREAVHTLDWHADVLLEWIGRLGLCRIVLVHDAGAPELGARLAARAPGRFAAVLLSPNGPVEAGDAAFDTLLAARRAPFPDAGHEAALRALGRGGARAGPSPAQAHELVRAAMGYFAP